NHPLAGPIFSGPHQTPFYCQTQTFGLPSTQPPVCATPTRIQYFYYSSKSHTKKSFDPSGPRPDDIATTTTSTGHAVPFIVREETGTINRAVYQIAILDDPAQPGPDPWTLSPGWNGRLIYLFGGGCAPGHHQGTKAEAPNVLRLGFLEKGYAVATSTLNALRVNCNPVL